MKSISVLVVIVVGLTIMIMPSVMPAFAQSVEQNYEPALIQPDGHDPRDCDEVMGSGVSTVEIIDVCHIG